MSMCGAAVIGGLQTSILGALMMSSSISLKRLGAYWRYRQRWRSRSLRRIALCARFSESWKQPFNPELRKYRGQWLLSF
jgi:hypothetical protein